MDEVASPDGRICIACRRMSGLGGSVPRTRHRVPSFAVLAPQITASNTEKLGVALPNLHVVERRVGHQHRQSRYSMPGSSCPTARSTHSSVGRFGFSQPIITLQCRVDGRAWNDGYCTARGVAQHAMVATHGGQSLELVRLAPRCDRGRCRTSNGRPRCVGARRVAPRPRAEATSNIDDAGAPTLMLIVRQRAEGSGDAAQRLRSSFDSQRESLLQSVQPSSSTALPSSHSSLPCLILSPQNGRRQSLVHSSVPTALPSSHSSSESACQ